MQNKITFSSFNPKTIRLTGTGEYVKKECRNLVETFKQAWEDHLAEIRQDNE